MAKFKFKPNKCDPDDPTTTVTNGQRAKSATDALWAWRAAKGEGIDPSNVTDLIADLGHLCDREGQDFEAAVKSAMINWRAER